MLDPALATSARDGLTPMRAFIATRFDLADEYEERGETADAAAIRKTWTDVLDSLDTLDRATAAELEMPLPAHELIPA